MKIKIKNKKYFCLDSQKARVCSKQKLPAHKICYKEISFFTQEVFEILAT